MPAAKRKAPSKTPLKMPEFNLDSFKKTMVWTKSA